MVETLAFILAIVVAGGILWPALKDLRAWRDSPAPATPIKVRASVNRMKPCRRCGILAENPAPFAVVASTSAGAATILGTTCLCVHCVELFLTDRRAFMAGLPRKGDECS